MWIKGLEKIKEHATLEYHMTAIAKMQEFKSTYENPSRAIDMTFDKELHRRIHDNQTQGNRVSLFVVIKMTELIGKNTLAAKEIF